MESVEGGLDVFDLARDAYFGTLAALFARGERPALLPTVGQQSGRALDVVDSIEVVVQVVGVVVVFGRTDRPGRGFERGLLCGQVFGQVRPGAVERCLGRGRRREGVRVPACLGVQPGSRRLKLRKFVFANLCVQPSDHLLIIFKKLVGISQFVLQ